MISWWVTKSKFSQKESAEVVALEFEELKNAKWRDWLTIAHVELSNFVRSKYSVGWNL